MYTIYVVHTLYEYLRNVYNIVYDNVPAARFPKSRETLNVVVSYETYLYKSFYTPGKKIKIVRNTIKKEMYSYIIGELPENKINYKY